MGETLSLNPTDTIEIVSAKESELEVVAAYAPGGSPPPPHWHPAQDERFEVLAGSVTALVEGQERALSAGERIGIDRGQVHQIWNPGELPARVRWVTAPAGRTEEWFRTLDRVLGPEGAVARGEEVDFQGLLEEFDDVFRLQLD
jgi:quercetin dioxygenase-like cupin family protein